jgi:acyl carrier protein
MTEAEALEVIRKAMVKTLDREPAAFTIDTDLVKDGVLDSLDGMVFILHLTEMSNAPFPQEGNLVEQGLLKVRKLVEIMTGASSG